MILSQYFVEFIFYSLLGWVWEALYCTIREKAWQDRGFLFGPICPIYGASVVAVMILSRFVPQISSGAMPAWGIFLICMAGSAVAEYATSWVLEKRFHMRWWDYSDMPLNLNGRICGEGLTVFALGGMAAVYLLVPVIDGAVTRIKPKVLIPVCILLVLSLCFDLVYSMNHPNAGKGITDYEEYTKTEQEAAAAFSGIRIVLPEMQNRP